MNIHLRRKSNLAQFLIILLFIQMLLGSDAAKANSLDMTTATVAASEQIEVKSTPDTVSIYLGNFRPKNEVWINVTLPTAQKLQAREFVTSEFDSTGTATKFSFTLPASLPLTSANEKLGELVTEDGTKSVQIYATPPDFPSWSIEGDATILGSKQLLMNASVPSGSYTVAISKGRIEFFQKSSRFTLGFKKFDAKYAPSVLSGKAVYAYMERVQLSKTFYTQGIWNLLDANFEQIGVINKPIIMGKPQITEGHDITTSPAGNPVVMAYIDRRVDSSWLDKPFVSTNVLDCVFSEVRDGRAIRTFSFWNWVNTHRIEFKKILAAGDRNTDSLIPTNPVDFCHANSLEYSPELNAYLISLRSIDVVMQVDSKLEKIERFFHTPGARQHFVEYSAKNGYSALANYTGRKNSKFQQWTKKSNKWILHEYDFPYSLPFCGNAQKIDDSFIWLAGGCSNFLENTMGKLFKISGNNLMEISTLLSTGTTGSYRTEIN